MSVSALGAMWDDVRAWWPDAASSSFVECRGMRWHVQRGGSEGAPTVVFVHGSGASAHSWFGMTRGLPPAMGWIRLDLPGHGLTQPVKGGLPSGPIEIAEAVSTLLDALDARPTLAVGHSAGAIIAAEVARRQTSIQGVLALNPAVLPAASGLSLAVTRQLAPLLASNPGARGLAGLSTLGPLVDWLLAGTGSRVPEWSRRCYRYLLRQPRHIQGVIHLFHHWHQADVRPVLEGWAGPLWVVAGDRDRWVPPKDVRRGLQGLPGLELSVAEGGHLVHEEAPGSVLRYLLALDEWTREGRPPPVP